MQFKPTIQALEIASKNGTARQLNEFSGTRSNIASNLHAGAGRRAGKHLNALARKTCGIPAGVTLFKPITY